jgi:transcriptional regulator with XRE-family HTH domain
MLVRHRDETISAEQHFGAQVREARETRGWSQEVLSRHLKQATGMELHQTGLARLELGKRPIRLDEAVALCEVLGLDLSQYGGAAQLSEEGYHEALDELKHVRDLEQQATEALEGSRQVVSLRERDVARLRDTRLRLEAAIREYEERTSGER